MNKSRKKCPMRHENGNCLPAGGFCTAVNDPICEALHNAFRHGESEASAKYQQKNLEVLRKIHEKITADTTEVATRKWIPVTEQLPEMYKGVLVCSESRKISINWRGCNGDWNSYGNITHWMHLPEAPRVSSRPSGDTL